MNTRDLFELCELDALGLLDEHERAAFDAAFMAAPAEIRAQLRREQARWVKTDLIGLEDEPPESLRDAVLADVGVAAIRERVLHAVHEEIVKSGAGSVPVAVVHAGGRSTPALRPVRRVSRLWRAATLGFASAAVALAATTLYLRDKFDMLISSQRDDQVLADLASLPNTPIYDLLFDARFRSVVLSPADSTFKGLATLHFNSEKGDGRLFVRNLPNNPGKSYRLYALDASGERLLDSRGQAVELARFSSRGGLQVIQKVRFNPAVTARVALCEVSDEPGDTGQVVMSATLMS